MRIVLRVELSVSQNVAAKVLILNGFGEHLLDIGGVDVLFLWFQIRSFKTNLFQQFFHDRLQGDGRRCLPSAD